MTHQHPYALGISIPNDSELRFAAANLSFNKVKYCFSLAHYTKLSLYSILCNVEMSGRVITYMYIKKTELSGFLSALLKKQVRVVSLQKQED